MNKTKQNQTEHNLWKSFLNLIFPKYCLNCGMEGDWLCNQCQYKIKFIENRLCPICKRQTKLGELCLICRKNYELSGVLAASRFKKPVKNLIHQLKYKNSKELIEVLAKITAKGIKAHLKPGDRLLVPIPLHKSQLEKRGFNQAKLLASKLEKKLKTPVKNILKRIKKTRSQTKLSRQERKKNLKDAFNLGNKIDLKGKIIYLVDDVCTTGTTLEEAAKVLKKAGAEEVWGLTTAIS